ncbi:MAG: hypothetical protein QF486_02560 [Candidatus Woesearchaeota archaeon]|jgi:hypothetical protein|nr:hypothetical protein [Candidatus Woesearchaeota archaeon]MDP7198477.1 hypothetical protein [Candidatus Woesearchaeota archaeon]MDP7466781.1 hypothetical protein [Candidatus Woesearchaeota archaeon]MDP7648006.1 hypothetical protein [Candidatus Woesearchaeota archaeon]
MVRDCEQAREIMRRYVNLTKEAHAEWNAGGEAYEMGNARVQFGIEDTTLDDEEFVGVMWVRKNADKMPERDVSEGMHVFYVDRSQSKTLKARPIFTAPSTS